MDRSNCDVVIIGMGLGAVAMAMRLAEAGVDLIMLPGAGRARFNHLDGGVVDPGLLSYTLGDIASAPVHRIGDDTVFRRDEFESWAIQQLPESVQIVHDFEEARVLPHDFARLDLIDASGEKKILANSVVLTEGANPKIGIAARVRTDFDPEDMIHFGRTFLPGVTLTEPLTGSWRTSWNMPAWYSAIPQPNGALVSASVRIENVMRSGRDGRAALSDFLGSDLAQDLGLTGDHDEIGMELVPLKREAGHGRLGAHNIMISLDANGTIDARSLERFNASLRAGAEMGAMMAQEWPNLMEWDVIGTNMWDMFSAHRTPYHDDKNTGFIEDGPDQKRGLLGRLFNRPG